MWVVSCFFFGTLLVCGGLVKFAPYLYKAMTVVVQRLSTRAFPVGSPFEYNYLSRIYLQQRHASGGNYAFTYRQLNQPVVSDSDIARNHFVPFMVKPVCELAYTVAY